MPGASEALGERLRAAREARGLSLSDVAEQIRIRSLYLAAIEEENWNTVGAPVYVRGFLRTYARFLGMDPEEAVAAFNRNQPAYGSPQAGPGRQGAEPEGSLRRNSLLIWIAGVVAVLLIAFVVYNEVTLRRAPVAANVAASPVATTSPSVAAATPLPSPTAGARPSGPAGGANSLALVLLAPSWLRVTVDGSVSMEGTFPAGTAKTFHGKNALVRIGNAGGVEIYVDGKDVGKLGKPGDVVEHTFTL
ncbi:MAG: helix-turn-helix domain-containing protein [Candidatus Eremiobacteraeota bacterium]|nr:helix-turn-helix domain-containing protein [Candidatus Eremiobacteraeota bacterium]